MLLEVAGKERPRRAASMEPAMRDPGLDQLVDHLDRIFGALVTAAAGDELKAATFMGTYGVRRAVDLLLEDGDPEARELLKIWAGCIADGLAGRKPTPDPSLILH
jgi:hypothetical protein